ncbi:exonuclease V subunit gamma, partial [Vibrio parahaemolyticus]
WYIADNQVLEGLDVHCVFPVNDAIRDFILTYQQQYKIRSVSFTDAFAQRT